MLINISLNSSWHRQSHYVRTTRVSTWAALLHYFQTLYKLDEIRGQWPKAVLRLSFRHWPHSLFPSFFPSFLSFSRSLSLFLFLHPNFFSLLSPSNSVCLSFFLSLSPRRSFRSLFFFSHPIYPLQSGWAGLEDLKHEIVIIIIILIIYWQ